MNKNIINNFNEYAKELGIQDSVCFFDDSIYAVKKVAPYGKVAVIYNKSSFYSFGKQFTDKLKVSGIKPINFIMPELAVLNFESVFDVIGVPEDVRAVVFFDSNIKDIAYYIATIFRIPCIFVMRSGSVNGILSCNVKFSYEKSADPFYIDCQRLVVLEGDTDYCDFMDDYISLVTEYSSLIDYFVRESFYGEENNSALTFAENALKTVIEYCVDNGKKSAEVLFENSIKFQLANLSVDGKICINSAKNSFFTLINKNVSTDFKFTFLKKLVEIYSVCCENENPLAVANYTERANVLKKITGKDVGVFLSGFKKQLQTLKKGNIDSIVCAVKDLVYTLKEDVNKIEKLFFSLGGKSFETFDYSRELLFCGDLHDTLNFMTIARERGLCET